jgi:UDP-N-acetylglucosamine 2-epimerase
MSPPKVVTVVGARPQFVKAAPVSRKLRQRTKEVLIHTGQHYDDNMSAIFFRELGIPEPDYHLGVGSGLHGAQTGEMLARIESTLLVERPDWVLIYGDTNSTLAAALAAAKLRIPVAHVEAGLRSFNRVMPEEVNRVVADHLSDLLFCPSQFAVEQLAVEGITRGAHLVGDVMADALLDAVARAQDQSTVLSRFGLSPGHYLLVTVHRAENTDDPARLRSIFAALEAVGESIVFPAHPRTRAAVQRLEDLHWPKHVRLIEPLGYLDMVRLARSARMILTDSGGLQKEAYWLGVPCITLRDETEWVETVQSGWNVLTGAETQPIMRAVREFQPPQERPELYGDGQAAGRVAELIVAGD